MLAASDVRKPVTPANRKKRTTPPKTNMEPENEPLEQEIP